MSITVAGFAISYIAAGLLALQIWSTASQRDFENRLKFLNSFRVDVRVSDPRLTYQDNRFLLAANLTNFGNNAIFIPNGRVFDIIRCYNRMYWSGSEWDSPVENSARDTSEMELGDPRRHGYLRKIFPEDSINFSDGINFPQRAFEDFGNGEYIAVEATFMMFDASQFSFKDEIDSLDIEAGFDLTIRGRPVSFPVMMQPVGRVALFQLQRGSLEWKQVNPNNASDCFKKAREN